MEPIAYDRTTAAQALGISPSEIDKLIKNGQLAVRYHGRKPLVVASSLKKYFESLPSEK